MKPSTFHITSKYHPDQYKLPWTRHEVIDRLAEVAGHEVAYKDVVWQDEDSPRPSVFALYLEINLKRLEFQKFTDAKLMSIWKNIFKDSLVIVKSEQDGGAK